MRSKSRLTITVILCILLGFSALGMTGCAATLLSGRGKVSATPTPTPKSTPSSTSTTPTPKAKNTPTPSPGTYGSWVAECFDENNHPTLYALCELKGWQLETFLQEQGWTWVASEKAWYLDPSDKSNLLGVISTNGVLTDEEIAKISAGGAGEPIVYTYSTVGYLSAEDFLHRGVKCVTEDSFVANDSAAVAVVYGPSMQRHIALVSFQDGVATINMGNEEALSTGLFEQLFGVKDARSIKDAWEGLTGKKLGDH